MKFSKLKSGGTVSPKKGTKTKAAKNAIKFANYVSPKGKSRR